MAEPIQQQEVLPWLKTLPLAPEFHPSLTEFQDPIAYIFKIEKEASQYGICKIVPPLSPSPKKTAITNLNRSLAERAAVTTTTSSTSSASAGPTFTTRQQQIGFCPRKPRPVQKPVWQSGEYYTFQQFETKAKNFEKSYLKKKCGNRKNNNPLSALEIESLYWKATVDKPFSVEYANDMPGSAFMPLRKKMEVLGEAMTVAESAWNMRGVSRAKGSLLRFMKEEIPGVTSPMVYLAMLFSWFAWHAEDHDLHSLNYLHMGASKTWYGVPMDAANAFEEVVRVHGYGGEINPLVTFATLGEKTTMISPEVFVGAGVPCCRLVQNAGEFVVTFPRAYHMGFSHGFNCGEAANIATPEWLSVAKDAAIRRASINYPPMVSHFQLLYDLAIAFHSRVPPGISAKPRSSRLKEKKKEEGETLVKERFVQDVVRNNELLNILGKGSSIVLLPQSSSDISVCSELRVGSQLGVNPTTSLGLCSYKEAIKSSRGLVSNDATLGMNNGIKPVKGFYSMKGKSISLCERNPSLSASDNICTWTSQTLPTDTIKDGTVPDERLSDQRLFSCATCGILSFACVAVIQPREPTARYLMSADCSFFNDWIVGSGVTANEFKVAGGETITSERISSPRWRGKGGSDSLYDVPVQSVDYQIQMADKSKETVSDTETQRNSSALGLLALNYGDSSDSEDDRIEPNVFVYGNETNLTTCSPKRNHQQDFHGGATGSRNLSLSRFDSGDEAPLHNIDCYGEPETGRADFKNGSPQNSDCSVEFETDNLVSLKSNGLDGPLRGPITASHASNCSPVANDAENLDLSKAIVPIKIRDVSFAPRSDEDSSRMHVFCLEHAVEVEQQLRPIGGVHILLLCHPEYPKIVAEAKSVAEELGIDFLSNDMSYRNATRVDEERIQSALDSEDAIPGNGDWAVKLGINLFYSANLSRSSLYCKQMPYNSIIYDAFGRSSPATSPTKSNVYGRRQSRQKKVVAGKWCGKVWMSNQVHPFLVQKDLEEQEQETSFHTWATVDENFERKPEITRPTETMSVTRKFSRKRKRQAESGSIKKVKCIIMEDAGSDDSLEDDTHMKQKGTLTRKPSEFMEEEDASSYDSPEDISHQQKINISRRKLPKCIEREVEDSDDLPEENSVIQLRGIPWNKQAECLLREDAVSDDLPKDSSLKQYRRIPRSKLPKSFVREDAVSDDLSEDVSIKRYCRRAPRSKQTKCIEREDAVSDSSLGDNSHKGHRTIPRRKQTKWIEGDDAVSDSSLGKKSQLSRRIPKSTLAKWIEREDAVSDDSLEDNFHQQHKSIRGAKQAKCIEREFAVSDDSMEDNSQQCSRIPRSKKAKFIEKEDAVSYDSQTDNSPPRQGRILRSKQVKTETQHKIKQKTPSHMRPGERSLTRQVTPRQMKKGTPRPHNGKIEQDAFVQEEPEGGPSSRLRKRIPKPPKELESKSNEKKQINKKKQKNASVVKAPAGLRNVKKMKDEEGEYQCDVEGCSMSFSTKQELVLHKRNICPVKGCGKKFFSHKYLVQHRRVHVDERPLKCPWKGCKMTFKWAWARTEHIRVHTGARPYVCGEAGCGQTFRFVSDFSRHKRKTGHTTTKKGR